MNSENIVQVIGHSQRPKHRDVFRRTITDPNAPERLKGKVIEAILAKGRFTFNIDLPDDPTPQELGYFRWSVGELVEQLEEASGIKMTVHPLELKEKE